MAVCHGDKELQQIMAQATNGSAIARSLGAAEMILQQSGAERDAIRHFEGETS